MLLSLLAVAPAGGPAAGGTRVALLATGLARPLGGASRDGSAVHGTFCRFEAPAAPSTSQTEAAAAFAHVGAAEDRAASVRARREAVRALLVASIDPPAPHGTAALLEALNADVGRADAAAAAARAALSRLGLAGSS
eukprot:6137324-Prymnesium_polylepis.1